MSKSQNAFALRNFDKNHILQRPILKKFVQVDGDFFLKENCATDDEIIRDLSAITDDVNQNELNLRRLRVIWERLLVFQTKTIDRRHLPRLVRFKRSTVNPELKKRADFLYKEYDADAMQIVMTAALIEKKVSELEKIIPEQHRKVFSSRLRQARISCGLTQKETAIIIGLTAQNSYSQYESGKREPPITNLIRLSKVLNHPVDWLLGIT